MHVQYMNWIEKRVDKVHKSKQILPLKKQQNTKIVVLLASNQQYFGSVTAVISVSQYSRY